MNNTGFTSSLILAYVIYLLTLFIFRRIPKVGPVKAEGLAFASLSASFMVSLSLQRSGISFKAIVLIIVMGILGYFIGIIIGKERLEKNKPWPI